jgi:hypothetical protein
MCAHPTATHLQAERERTVATVTRTHFDHLRHARDSGIWLGTD